MGDCQNASANYNFSSNTPILIFLISIWRLNSLIKINKLILSNNVNYHHLGGLWRYMIRMVLAIDFREIHVRE